MADFTKMGTKILDALKPSDKPGKTLLVLNALGMALAALSNTFAASRDKNTSAQDKKFLIPAGLVTGIANIGVYFGMTTKMINFLQDNVGQKVINGMSESSLAENAKIFADKTIQKAQKGFLGTGLFKKSDEYVSSLKSVLKDSQGNITSEAKEMFKNNLKSGLGVMGAFAGAVIGCAIVTPIIRDVSAYFIQKKMEKNNPELQDKPYRPYFDPAHVKYGKQPLSMKSYMAFTDRLKV